MWYNMGGPINYDATFQTAIGGYPKGAILQSAVTVGLLWVNTVDNNLTNPDASGAGWTSYTPVNATTATTASNLNRPGWIFDFGGPNCPSGTFFIGTAGATVSRTTYAALFSAIGTYWGNGDGSTTFNLPSILQDQVTVQAGSGGNVGTSTVGQVIAHSHTYNSPFYSASAAGGGGNAVQNYTAGTATSITGGPYNLAAGVRVLKCIQY